MSRHRLTIAYDGTDFHGWQQQRTPDGGYVRTVQETLAEAITNVVRAPVDVVGASRTDAGVHARGQVAAFSAEHTVPLERLPEAITSRLPDDVQALDAAIVADDFDPIALARSKGYSYHLCHGVRTVGRPLFDRRTVAWTAYPLDVEAMSAAGAHLVGEHDFASFTRVNHGREHTVRTVLGCTVERLDGQRCRFDVSGTGFLYNMVRIIVGTLVDVGRGNRSPDDVPGMLEARDRSVTGQTMPPEGLCLEWVSYDTPSPSVGKR